MSLSHANLCEPLLPIIWTDPSEQYTRKSVNNMYWETRAVGLPSLNSFLLFILVFIRLDDSCIVLSIYLFIFKKKIQEVMYPSERYMMIQ